MNSEAALEQRCVAYAKKHGCVLLKIQGAMGWPDRLCLMPGGKGFFIEFKAPGQGLRPKQKAVQAMLDGLGFGCFEVDNRHLFERLLNERL